MNYLRGKGTPTTKLIDKKPILQALYNAGYSREVLCKELHISKPSFNDYFSRPENFKLYQLKTISYLLVKPIGYVINTISNYKESCPQWVNDSVDGLVMEKTHEYKKGDK